MTRLGRLVAVALVLFGSVAVVQAPARADCTNPLDDDFGDCPTPSGGPPPTARPSPTPHPTVAPTPAPTAARTASPTRRPTTSTTRSSTPAPPAIDNVEVPTVAPNATPEIIVDGPIADDQPLDVAEPSASASSWIFGFIVGLVIGGFIGRASWGLRRRRRQQIFG